MDRRLIACSCDWCESEARATVVTPRDTEVARDLASEVWQTVFHCLDRDYINHLPDDVATSVAKAAESCFLDRLTNPPPKAAVATTDHAWVARFPATDEGFYEARAFGEKHCYAYPGWEVRQVNDLHGLHHRLFLFTGSDGTPWWAEGPPGTLAPGTLPPAGWNDPNDPGDAEWRHDRGLD